MKLINFRKLFGFFLVFFISSFFLFANYAWAADDPAGGLACKCNPAYSDCTSYADYCVKNMQEAGQKCMPAHYYGIVECAEGKECIMAHNDATGRQEANCVESPRVKEEKEFADQPEVILEVPFGGEGGESSPVIGLPGYILVVYEYIVVIVALVAAMMIVWGGFKWTTSAGNSSQIASAKSTITNAIIGLVLALTSYVLLATINPALVNLEKLKIPMVHQSFQGCDGVVELMGQGKVTISGIDEKFIRGDTNQRDGTAPWCYGKSNGSCSGPPSDNRGEVTINPKICEVIIAAANELIKYGKPAIISSIIGSHSKCAGAAECAGPTPACTACLGPPNQSPHWEGRGVDISYGNLETAEIEAMNLAICQKVQGLSQIISRPSKNPTGALWEGGGCGPGSEKVTKHHDHTHVTIQK